jgi:hypothetical protein
MKKLLVIILILIPTNLFAADWFSWDKENTALHVPLTALMVVDLGQTLWIADNCDYRTIPKSKGTGTFKHYKCSESNSLIGDFPSRGEVWTYFGASYALTTLATWVLPEKYSHALQGGVISLEVYAIDKNVQIGVGFKF